MKFVIHPDFSEKAHRLHQCIKNFESEGEFLGEPARNSIKIFNVDGMQVNIKSFRIPILINGLIYGMFRKSKAQRSYEYALRLLEKGIGTPKPIAYFENKTSVLKDSYYISEQLDADLTFRELTTNLAYPEHEIILRQFMAFTFKLHENGIEFLDNTPGNTLIKKTGDKQYEFFLVDLNRMKFHQSMTFEQRIINMRKLTKSPELIAVMSDAYAALCGKSYDAVHTLLTRHMQEFQTKLAKKKELKKKLSLGK